MPTHVLVTNDGRVLIRTNRLAGRSDMRPAILGDDGKLIVPPAKLAKEEPEPVVKTEQEVAPIVADETPLTAERLDAMEKPALQSYAKQRFGVDLDMRRSPETLRGQVWRLHEEKAAGVPEHA
ncbi:MAG: hypothetical protein WC565_09635 [Parcubacteria group bacterium]